ncbi:sensor histidine kinase [Nocardiopsis sp. NPDC055551]
MNASAVSHRRGFAPAVDLLLWAVLGGLAVAELSGDEGRSGFAESTVALAVVAIAVGSFRRSPSVSLAVATAYATAQTVSTGLGLFTTLYLFVPVLVVAVLSYRYGLRSDRPGPVVAPAILAAAVTFTVNAAAAAVFGLDTRAYLSSLVDWTGGALALVLALVAPWLFARYQRRRLSATRGAWALAERMERTRAAEADRARLRERTRIASRMHDSLGHDLALIAVRAAALEMSAQDDPERREAASELREAAHEANLRLREVIGVLREDSDRDSAEPEEGISALVEHASDAGLSVRLLREGPDPEAGSVMGRTVHRVVREGLTNAAKYAPGGEVSVRVVRGEDAVRVTVTDTGPVETPILPARTGEDAGGLAGLRALVEEHGGEITAGPGEQGGFEVRALVPERPEDIVSDEPASQTGRLRSEADERARRSLRTALIVPVALTTGLIGFGFLTLWWLGENSVLPPSSYERLSVGDTVESVQEVSPRFEYPARSVDHPPPPPPEADDCRFYLVEHESGLPPVYRLCFDDGVLVAKEHIERHD